MFPLHQFFLLAALSGAVFPRPSLASELDEYYALKAALVRSSAKSTPQLPKWIKADELEARPHYWLDAKKSQDSFVVSEIIKPKRRDEKRY